MQSRTFARAAIAATLVLTCANAAEAARKTRSAKTETARQSLSDRECLARAMYFESNRNQEDGMLAVGTIVANRVESGRYGASVCGVVGKFAQFAPGVLSRPMLEKRPAERARQVADAVLAGGRHPLAGDAVYFHTANVPFRNDDKTYVLVSGGNAFYRWNRGGGEDLARANLASFREALDEADEDREAGRKVVDAVLRPKITVTPPLFVARAETVTAQAPTAMTSAPAQLARALSRPEGLSPKSRPGDSPIILAKLEPKPRVVAFVAPIHAAAGPVWPASASRFALAETRSAFATGLETALTVLASLKGQAAKPGDAGRPAKTAGDAKPQTPRVVTAAAPVLASAAPVSAADVPADDDEATGGAANLVVALAFAELPQR